MEEHEIREERDRKSSRMQTRDVAPGWGLNLEVSMVSQVQQNWQESVGDANQSSSNIV